jgi:hypothetical protein
VIHAPEEATQDASAPDSPPLNDEAIAAFAAAAKSVASIEGDEARDRALHALDVLLGPAEPDPYERVKELLPVASQIFATYLSIAYPPARTPSPPCPCRGPMGSYVAESPYPAHPSVPDFGTEIGSPGNAGVSVAPSLSIRATLQLNDDQVAAIRTVLTPEQIARVEGLGLTLV